MTGLIIKLIVCPITIIVASYIFPNVEYTYLWQPIAVGLIVAIAAHMMEVFLLRENTFWISALMDFGAATLMVYFVSLFLVGAEDVTVFGSFLTGLLLTITEMFQHRYLIRNGRTRKTPA